MQYRFNPNHSTLDYHIDTMISNKMGLLYFMLLMASSSSLADNVGEISSKITIKENFNSPAIMTPVSPYGPPTVSSNFVHQGTNFFFNPQILLGSNFPPIGAVVATVNSNDNKETPADVEVTTPKLPDVEVVVPEIIIEEPTTTITPPPPPPPTLIPITPEQPDEVVLEEIPPAPILPPLELPKIPVWIEETVKVATPCKEEIIITDVKPAPPVVLPEPPSLPPLILPPKPVLSEIEIIEEKPTGPNVVEVPITPEKEVSETLSKMKFRNEESVQIMSAPALALTEADLKINEITDSFDIPDIEELVSIDGDKTVLMLPPSPEFSAIEINNPVIDVVMTDKIKQNGLLISDPTDCAHNIVLERILPNMISKKTVTKSLEIVSYPAAKYPVITSALIPSYVIKS